MNSNNPIHILSTFTDILIFLRKGLHGIHKKKKETNKVRNDTDTKTEFENEWELIS